MEIGPRLDPPREDELQVVLATDAGFAPHVELAVYSLLNHCSCPLRVVILCGLDTIGHFPRLDALMPSYPTARVEYIAPPFLADAARDHRHSMSVISFARMLIPHLMSGRVLYLDADVLVTGDVAPARDLDLHGHPIAGALDAGVLRFLRWLDPDAPRDLFLSAKRRARTEAHLAKMHAQDIGPEGYINAGVLILDCDAIARDPQRMEAMLNLERAQGFWALDQDLLNEVFAGDIHLLPPEWNVWNALTRVKSAPFTAADRAQFQRALTDPIIVHFMSNPKPWSKLHLRHLTRGWRHHRAYWRAEQALSAALARDQTS